jgi:hypothetical protein
MSTNGTNRRLELLLPQLPSVEVVAAVGFGWGAHPALMATPDQDQRIGDVMFSSACIDVSHHKTIPGSIDVRGDITSAVPRILDSVNNTLIEAWQDTHTWPHDWIRDPTVHIGPFLSCATLMNDSEFTKKVLQATESRKPIGGDMETYQVVEAARNAGKSWFTVKSICDFGGLIPKDKEGQKLAAATAADFMHFMMSREGLLIELLGPPIGLMRPPTFRAISGTLSLTQVYADTSGTLYGVDSHGQACMRANLNVAHTVLLPVSLKQVAVSGDGSSKWGVTSDNNILRCTYQNAWEPFGGILKWIDVTSDGSQVWGVNLRDEIFRRDLNRGEWEKVDGLLVQLCVSGNGDHIWGVNKFGDVFHRSVDRAGGLGEWHKYDIKLSQVSVNNDGSMVWGIASSGDVYYFLSGEGGNRWEKVPGILFQSIAVSGDGHLVYGSRKSDGSVYYYSTK